MLQTIDTILPGRLEIRKIALTLVALFFATPSLVHAQETTESISLTSTLSAVENEIREAGEYNVYSWSCSRSLHHAGTFENLQDAFQLAGEQMKRSPNVRVVVGKLESPWIVIRDSQVEPHPVELLVYQQEEDQGWALKATMNDRQHARLVHDAIVEAEGKAQIVMRFE